MCQNIVGSIFGRIKRHLRCGKTIAKSLAENGQGGYFGDLEVFENHLEETKGQVERLEQALNKL